ncbi:MAG: sigma 54-interacting transcriptional regulator [Pseudobdellovibrionaceae bacterium]|jgi:DNA-binding NtrC family response regulator
MPTFYLHSLNQESEPLEIGQSLMIGRSEDCQVVLGDTTVNDRHARLENKGEFVLLRDLRTAQGTFVNEEPILEKILQESDIIRIGEQSWCFSLCATRERASIGLSSKNENWNARLMELSNIARSEFPVLLLGASGTGKEILAQKIHENSNRKPGPFVSVNCSALTETLVESELFGHLKGSFTGAINDRKGAFEAARGGTLFLDEVGDLPYPLQAKLLRALENNEIRPVGSDRNYETDVRIVAATHQNLAAKVQSGEFRGDLYYRLNVIQVLSPKLADRMEDFEDLLYHFAKTMKVRFSFGAIQSLKKHSWPGNIRELKNAVARASALFPRMHIQDSMVSQLIDRELCVQAGAPAPGVTAPGQLPVIKEIEKQMIIKRLMANQGNQRKTASELGIPKSTLHDRIKTYGINLSDFIPKYRSAET